MRPRPSLGSLCLTLVMGVIATTMVVTALDFTAEARTAPLVIGVPTVAFIVLQLVLDGVRTFSAKPDDSPADAGPTPGSGVAPTSAAGEAGGASTAGTADAGGTGHDTQVSAPASGAVHDRSTSAPVAILWVVGLAGLIWLAGMWVAIPVFIAAFMKLFGHERWLTVIGFSLGTTAAVYLLFTVGLEVQLYSGLAGELLS